MSHLMFLTPILRFIQDRIEICPSPEQEQERDQAFELVEAELDRHITPELREQMHEFRERAERAYEAAGGVEAYLEAISDDDENTFVAILHGGEGLADGWLFIEEFFRELGVQGEYVAYWVKDEALYTANDAAKTLSPDLPDVSLHVSPTKVERRIKRFLKEVKRCERL